MLRTFGLFGMLLSFACAAPSTATPVVTVASVDARISALEAIERSTGGVLGVEVVPLGPGRPLSLHGSDTFPMASTFKVAVALALLRRVDSGEVRLGDDVRLEKSEMRRGMGDGIAERFPEGTVMKVQALAEAMIEQSDNTATDALLHHVGDPVGVTKLLRQLGITGMRVDRSEREMRGDIERDEAGFSRDPRDQTTPQAMAQLLSLIVRGKGASPSSTEKLLAWLAATTTGTARLKAGLPNGATLMHKTGTFGGDGDASSATNDVGIVTMQGGSRVILVVYLRDAKAPPDAREKAVADVARVVLGSGR